MTKGLVRELRIRWALEELGVPYAPVIFDHPDIKKDSYLVHQPFGQVPYFQDENVDMFESGAILLHLGLKHGKLLSSNEVVRAETLTWFVAGLNSLEPWMLHRFMLKMKKGDPALILAAEDFLLQRLEPFSTRLWDREFLAGSEFSIADLLLTTIFRELERSELLQKFPTLMAFKERNEEREAFKKALADHEKLYDE